MTIQLKPIKPATGVIEYPEADGRPMAEADLHRDLMFYVIHLLRRYLAGQQVYVSGNLLLYYEERAARVEAETVRLREELARLSG